MKNTCLNCKHFCGYLEDPDLTGFHVHNFCRKWNLVLGSPYKCELNKVTQDLCNLTDDICPYDDIELGEANCYLFEATNPTYSDNLFEERKNDNLKSLKKAIDILLENIDDEDPYNNPYSREELLIIKDKFFKEN